MLGVPASPLLKILCGHSHCSTESLSGFLYTTPPLQKAKSLTQSWLAAACLLYLPWVQVESLSLPLALSWLSFATAPVGVPCEGWRWGEVNLDLLDFV